DQMALVNAPLSGAVTQFIRAWGQAVGQFGFFNINMVNSGSPETEKEILADFSYGRQLGRILDVLTPIAKEHQHSSSIENRINQKDLEDYLEMEEKIRITKKGHTIATLRKAVSDLRKDFSDEASQEKFNDIEKKLRELEVEPLPQTSYH
ncbi:MAG TPA: hypothetical protein VHK70_10480, partial [Burkholderiaceae bacterium]|nr:hypothetical protein [Burkholderiaceae bacterium]